MKENFNFTLSYCLTYEIFQTIVIYISLIEYIVVQIISLFIQLQLNNHNKCNLGKFITCCVEHDEKII